MLNCELQHAGLGPAQLEQVVDERGEVVGLLAEPAVVAVDGLRVVDDAVLERLGHRPDAGERRAQVVRDPGDELAARRLERAFAPLGLVEAALHLGELGAEPA